jgi:hypothetical protein
MEAEEIHVTTSKLKMLPFETVFMLVFTDSDTAMCG